MDVKGRKLSGRIICIKYFIEVKLCEDLDLFIGFRYKMGMDVVEG